MGDDVRKLQTQLEQHGMRTGGVDGKFGPMTQRAVIGLPAQQGALGQRRGRA